MLTKRTAIAKAKIFLAECNSLPFKIDRAILFGSAINGKAKENSDIDMALFSESFSDNILTNLDLIGAINIRFPDIDAHTYPTRFYHQQSLMMDEILRTGLEMKL